MSITAVVSSILILSAALSTATASPVEAGSASQGELLLLHPSVSRKVDENFYRLIVEAKSRHLNLNDVQISGWVRFTGYVSDFAIAKLGNGLIKVRTLAVRSPITTFVTFEGTIASALKFAETQRVVSISNVKLRAEKF